MALRVRSLFFPARSGRQGLEGGGGWRRTNGNAQQHAQREQPAQHEQRALHEQREARPKILQLRHRSVLRLADRSTTSASQSQTQEYYELLLQIRKEVLQELPRATGERCAENYQRNLIGMCVDKFLKRPEISKMMHPGCKPHAAVSAALSGH